MKRLLLSGALISALALPAFADYSDVGGESHRASFEGVNYECYILDEESRMIGIRIPYYLNTDEADKIPSDFRIPSVLPVEFTELDESGSWVTFTKDYTVAQINRGAMNSYGITSLTIPSTVKVIGTGAFYNTSITSVTFEESDEPIEFESDIFYDGQKALRQLSLLRSIVHIPSDADDQNYRLLPDSDNEVEVTIGSKVSELPANLFSSLPNISRVNISDWGKWYNDVKLGNLGANPYANGKAAIYVAGMKLTTFEIPSDATEIPDYKLYGMAYQGELNLPESLKRIGAYSFAGNKDLFYINLPEGLEEIGDNAFENCHNLRFEQLPSTLESIGAYAFSGCNLISSITLPASINRIGEGAFYNMESLKKAVLFSGLTELPDFLLAGCKALENVYLPKRLLRIGTAALMNCLSLEEITLPETLEEIGDAAFANAYVHAFGFNTKGAANTLIYNDPETSEYDENAFNFFSGSIGTSHTNLTKINFPGSLKKIGRFAFFGNRFITLEFNEGLTMIGNWAFHRCDALRDVKFPSTLLSIGNGAFGCTHYYSGEDVLNSVVIPNSVKEIGWAAFMRPIGEITVGSGTTALAKNSLGVASIINLNENVKSLESGVLDAHTIADEPAYWHRLRLIRIKSNTPPTVSERFGFSDAEYDRMTLVVNDGRKDAFKRNPYWEKFNIIEESKSEITVYVSGDYPISEEIRTQTGAMPSTVSKMIVTGRLADSDYRLIRENMLSLNSLDLSAISNTEIPENAFTGMPQLTEIKLPANTVKIGAGAFMGNTLMDTEYLPESITEIGREAFSGCARLSITKLPDALTTLNGDRIFYGCKSLRTLTFGDKLVASEPSVNYAYMFSDCSLLEFADMSQTGIEVLGHAYFAGCSNLRNVALPASLRQIADEAFANTALESIEIPENVSEISPNAFNGTFLRTLTIPENIETIRNNTFGNNPRLVAITLPSSLREIEANVFDNSSKLSAISCSAINAPVAATGAFSGIRASQCSLTVPQQSFRSYLNAPQWGMFSELYNRLVVEIPENIEVTAVEETEYKEIVEEERLKAEAEAPLEDIEADDDNDDESTPEARRRAIRRAASNGIASGASFARLFNGAMLGTSSSSNGTRIFINPKEGAVLKSVIYNGTDVTSRMEGNSLLLTGSGNGTLQINTEGSNTAIDEIDTDGVEGICQIFNMQGVLLYTGAQSAASLEPGVYVVRDADGHTEKIVIR